MRAGKSLESAEPKVNPVALKIQRIELIPLVVPLDHEYRGSYYGMTHRATIITRLHTEVGIIGVSYAADEDKTLGAIASVINQEITPKVLGEDAFAYTRHWETSRVVTFDQLRDRRISLVAQACVDLAIWDAIGKALGQPLWRLWGGFRGRMPVNIIGGYYGDPGRIGAEVDEWKSLGFRGCKFKVGGRDPKEDAARVEAARKAAGDDFLITIDANQGYDIRQALELCRRVSHLNIRWFEEPCIWSNDRRDMREVRARGGIPVCAGQSEHSPAGCRDLMEAGAIDVCNFDASWAGGATNWLRMAAIAHSYSVELAHHEEPQVAAHLLASQPNGTYVEVFHPLRDPVWWNLIVNRPEIIDGWMTLPDGPGLGWELDQEFVEHYRVEP